MAGNTATHAARQLALLGILLQVLHPLFGITALMGVLINHVKIDTVRGSVYYSQLRWQIVSFWSALVLYVVAFWWWGQFGTAWPLVIAALYALYRIATSVWYWLRNKALERIL